MLDSNDEAIWHHLREFSHMPTPSPFSQVFYQVIAEYATDSAAAEASRELLARFLDREVFYYRQIERLRTKEDVTVADLESLAGKRNIALYDLIEEATDADSQTTNGEIARQLLLAECYYHVEEPEKAVAHLELALADGADNSIVHFALGYNRYRLAIESFGTTIIGTTDVSAHQRTVFRKACLQAVSAFQNALTGTDNDGEIYQWIARALQTADLDEAAEQAFDKAEDLVYSDYDESEGGAAQSQEGDEHEFGHRKPITEAEIKQVGELLKGSHDISDFWPGLGTN